MARRKQDDLDWLVAQVAVAYADGGMVQSGAVYEA